MLTSQRYPSVQAQEDFVLVRDIEPSTNTRAASVKTSEASVKTSEGRVVPRRPRGRMNARSVIRPLRSVAIFGAVGALIAAVALPAYATSKPAESAATVQQLAAADAQSLVVASQATAAPLSRGTFTATTPDEISKKKAEEAAAARAAARASTASTGATFDIGNYALVSPGSGEVRYPLPAGTYRVTRTLSSVTNGADMVTGDPGIPIYATAAGVVRNSAESIGGYGVAVVIDHVIGGQAVSSLYGHMLSGSRQVQVGQTVEAGQLIGYVGSTGSSTANHLHFEVRVGGGLVEPIAWLAANAG